MRASAANARARADVGAGRVEQPLELADRHELQLERFALVCL